ncbi:MAG: hypothetical protein AB1295_03880 [Candidatus Micrarchaeota archaeon]
MVKTIAEFRDELRALRQEMFDNAEVADTHLVASWVDRLIISLEGLSHSLELMDVEMETMCRCCDTIPVASATAPKAKAKKPVKSKTAKSAAKKKPAKKRR